jgi:hypothetical protein
MRLGLVCIGVSVAVAASAAHAQRNRDDTAATKRACSVEECFFERDVRDFEVIDQTHIIVYTGSQRCAFHIELIGTFCDLSFAPDLYFSRIGDIPQDAVGESPVTQRGPTDPFGVVETSRDRRDLRICTNDLNVQVHGGAFTESPSTAPPPDRFGNQRTECRVSTIESITDDQLVELYVARRVIPPLPPMGAGEIEVGEQEEPDGAEPAPEPEEREKGGRRGR